MKRIKQFLFIFLITVLPLFFIQNIHSYFSKYTEPIANNFTIDDNTTYTVIHEKMDLNGTTYTEVLVQNFTNIPIGTTVTPPVQTYEGFNSPQVQTVTLNSYNNTVIRYQYERKKYNLTITNSQYVTTDTPSGQYYYEMPISLTADAVDSSSKPFAKWSDETTTLNNSFTLTEDTTVGPIYSELYHVTFEANNGDTPTTRTVIENQKIGDPPVVENNDCIGTTGTYQDRQCTYYYKFEGWYLEPNFQTQVNKDYIPTADVILYAKWNKLYYHNANSEVFNGDRLLDTGIQLFSEENADRNFIVEFTLENFPSGQASRTVVFANMDETGDPYPGVQFRYFNNRYNVNANVEIGNKKNTAVNYTVGNTVVLKRENGLFSYSLDGGATFTYYNDYTPFTGYFDVNATFGGEYDANGDPYRFMRGTISNMTIELSEYDTYTIHYDPNGGEGMMIDQNIKVDKTVNLNANTYTREDYLFEEWNTSPDGTGTPYTNKQQVSQLGGNGDVITLYAQWQPAVRYYIHFDANGGTGTMPNQKLLYDDEPRELSPFAFTRNGYMFIGWNTASDGSGTSYTDRQLVQNLTNIEDDVIVLYAQYMRIAYQHEESMNFNGTSDIIDTGVNLYSSTTLDKDFEIRVTIQAVDSDVLNQTQPTIINCKDESNPLWPGFNVRFNNSATTMVPTYKWSGTTGSSSTLPGISTTNHLPITLIIKRQNKVVTFQHTYPGYESAISTLYDQDTWQLNQYFVDNITFGGIYNSSHNQDRFFKGTLSDMLILVAD